MKIESKKNGDTLTLAVSGRMDTVTAPDAEAAVRDGIDGVKELVWDLSGLEYISSAGLRVLLSAQKIMNAQGSMKVVGANEMIREIFEVTGFSDILTVE